VLHGSVHLEIEADILWMLSSPADSARMAERLISRRALARSASSGAVCVKDKVPAGEGERHWPELATEVERGAGDARGGGAIVEGAGGVD